jgi:7,8-dihydropterin-6-yl-methyl-4-(beta-D-ribofuranosyl)aminobenzene 5'-phosphate synthase
MLKAKDLQITTLVENTAGQSRILGEWGLSIYVRAGESGFLLDTGAGQAIVPNLRTLDIDLDSLEAIVLSHGHHDHTGGLRALLSVLNRETVRIVAHPDVWAPKYSYDKKTGKYRYSGIPFRREELERLGACFELTAGPTWLTDGIAASGEEPLTTSFESVAGSFYVKSDSGYLPDAFADDQSLYIRTEAGLVIVLGCAHRGVVNILRHARTLMGSDRIHMVLGGTHLGPAPDSQVKATIEALKEFKIDWLGVSHCTGLGLAAGLRTAFGKSFFFNNAGRTIRFPFEP